MLQFNEIIFHINYKYKTIVMVTSRDKQKESQLQQTHVYVK